MRTTDTIKGVVWEGTGPFLMAYVIGNDGAAITQATISSISYKVVDQAAPTVLINGGTFDKASTVFDTLQTGSRWTFDKSGYNFGVALPALAIPDGGPTYLVDIEFTPVSGAAFPVVFELGSKSRHRPSS